MFFFPFSLTHSSKVRSVIKVGVEWKRRKFFFFFSNDFFPSHHQFLGHKNFGVDSTVGDEKKRLRLPETICEVTKVKAVKS